METPVITLESSRRLSLPAETAHALGLHRGSRLAVTVTDGGIVLRPLLADDLDSLCGIFSSERDLVAELQAQRRQDKW